MDSFFFPHTLKIKQPGQNTFVLACVCRDQVNTGNDTVYLNSERTDYIFKSLVWIPKAANIGLLKPGFEIEVYGDHDEKRLSGVIARFEFGNLEEDRFWI